MTENNELSIKILCSLLVLIVGIAVTAAMYVNVKFKRRLDVLMENTRRMSAGPGAFSSDSGGDELAEIDEVYHQMHDDLTILRRHERAMLEKCGEAICSLDTGLSFTSVNRATEKNLGAFCRRISRTPSNRIDSRRIQRKNLPKNCHR